KRLANLCHPLVEISCASLRCEETRTASVPNKGSNLPPPIIFSPPVNSNANTPMNCSPTSGVSKDDAGTDQDSRNGRISHTADHNSIGLITSRINVISWSVAYITVRIAIRPQAKPVLADPAAIDGIIPTCPEMVQP